MNKRDYQAGEYRLISSESGIFFSIRFEDKVSIDCEYKLILAIDHELTTFKNAWVQLAYFQGNVKRNNSNYYENNPVTGEPCLIELVDGGKPIYHPIKFQLEILAESIIIQANFVESQEILRRNKIRLHNYLIDRWRGKRIVYH
jgi:hypothetical protein